MMSWLYLFLLCQFLFSFTVADREGDACRPSRDMEAGTCTLATRCDVVISHLKQSGSHPFNRCGFSGTIEIVCCPDTSSKFGASTTPPSTRGASKRIADIECEKLVSKSIPPLGLHIIGGERATMGDYPHMVALGFDREEGYKFDCGGSIISDRYVLTAAHCVVTKDGIQPDIVRTGVVELGSNEFNEDTDIRVERVIPHPQYTTQLKYNDLALLRLSKPLELYSNPNAACLYSEDSDPTGELTITGWGVTDIATNQRTNVLLKANVTVVDRETCSRFYPKLRKLPRNVTDEQICAGDSEGLRDTCQGDSGGPLQGLTSKDGVYRIVGITSFGRGCGSKAPGIYTRVSKYLDWIESVVWPRS